MPNCIVCGHAISQPLFNPQPQPLSALNLPKSSIEAIDALRYPMEFHICAFCGHVWNVQFDYTQIPYAEDSNLMYNNGGTWQTHLQEMVDLILSYKGWRGGTAIDIGCGDGQFFSLLKQADPDTHYLGFEPGIEAEKIRDFEVKRDYFIPKRDLKRYCPSLIVCRHVIEHLERPRDFVAEIVYWCSQYKLKPICMYEVPCFNKALIQGRAGDYLYEHVSNFTSQSFKCLLDTSDYKIEKFLGFYNGEVLVSIATPYVQKLFPTEAYSKEFSLEWVTQQKNIKFGLDSLQSKYSRIVFWGATGKGAAFLNLFDITVDKFPFVVDSDKHKVGRYVPGTGQLIRYVEDLNILEPGVIIVTTPWRVKDICLEAARRGVTCPIYTLQNQNLERVDEFI